MQRKYNNKNKINQTCEKLKQEARVLGKKISENRENMKRRQQNKLYEQNPSLFLQNIGTDN